MKFIATLISTFSIVCLFGQNNLPTLSTTNIHAPICPNMWYETLFDSVFVVDIDGDPLTLISVTTSTPATIDPGNIFYYDNSTTQGTANYWIYANTLASGGGNITIQVSDGIDTATLTLPTVTIQTLATVSFISDTLTICSNYGIVNLNDNVNLPGGAFSSSALEWNSSDGYFDPLNSFITENSLSTFDYLYYDNGCQIISSFEIIYFTAGTATVSTTNATCTSAIGTATVTLAGGAPIASTLWSTGAVNQSTISGLAAGQYLVSITDTNSCHIDQAFTIDVTGVTLTPTVTDVLCNGQTNGAVTITSSGLTAPVNYFWSSGHTGTSVTGLAAGSYTVYATDVNNCQVSKVIQINQPTPLYADTYYNILPTCGLSDGEIEVANVSGGIAPYTIIWSNASTSNPLSAIPFGIYSATITDANGCQTIKTYYLSENNSADLYGTVTATSCGQNLGAIDAGYYIYSGDPVQSISWSNGATTEDISNLAANNYICTLTVANTGCKAIKGWNIPVVAPMRQDICVVTVDSLTTTNLVVWEKVQPVGIAYYNIYRETSIQGQFVLIDTVHFTNLSIFNDVVASPIERSWSYKIGAVNACNVEGQLSALHKTIHLDLIDNGSNVTVNWNAYIGTAFTNYNIWRYTNATGWQQIGTVPNNILTYTDNIAFTTAGLDYMVEFALTNPCSAEKAQDFNTVRSNRERGQFDAGTGTGVSNNGIEEIYLNNIAFFPNPTYDKITFVQEEESLITYTITSISGQQIAQVSTRLTTTEIDLSVFQSGIYLVEMTMGNSTITKRIVKL